MLFQNVMKQVACNSVALSLRKNSAAHLNRMEEIRSSIEATGFYDLTFEELQFGAKTAWRNAPRCIGRRFWQRLEVRGFVLHKWAHIFVEIGD